MARLPADATVSSTARAGSIAAPRKVTEVRLQQPSHLQPTLSTWQLWGIAVGLVISGEYFGWNFGWTTAGTLGFLAVTLLVASMYVAFIFSFTELTTAIPQAGGPFVYAGRALGAVGGFFAGVTTLIEFIFAPPAIALAIGAYLHVQFSWLEPRWAAVLVYLLFMLLNIVGVSLAASFEFVITVAAVIELIVFMAVVAPGAHLANFLSHGWAGQDRLHPAAFHGMFAAAPFAVWLFLAIEGVAMAAEETRNPARSIPIAYIGGILTLLALAVGVMIFAGAVGDWRTLAQLNDPLPQAMRTVVGAGSRWLPLLVWLGVLGLIASLHGIILGYSRQIFALSRAALLPAWLSRVHPQLQTPWTAILAGGAVGIAAILSDNWITLGGQSLTANLVILSALGALSMYAISMAAVFRLRRSEPSLARPFRTPFYPMLPVWTLLCTAVCLVSIAWYNRLVTALFVALLAVAYLAIRPYRQAVP